MRLHPLPQLAPLAALLLLAAAAPLRAADDSYTIKLSRPDKVGELYDVDATIDGTRTTTIAAPQHDSQVQTDNIKGEIQGRIEYLEVDKNGDPTSLVLTIKKLVDSTGKELLKPGQEVQIKRAPKSVAMTLSGGDALPDDAQKLLSELYGPHSPDSPSDDQTFGSPGPHKVGDSWPINKDLTAKALADSGMQIDPQQLAGTTTLKSTDTLNTIPVLRITCQLQTKDATPSSPNPAMRVDSLNLQLDLTGAFPVDPALQPPEMAEKMSMELHLTNLTTGTSVTTKSTLAKSVSMTPVKK